MYDRNPTCIFNTNYEPGYYQIKHFVKRDNECRISFTEIFYLNEKRIDLSGDFLSQLESFKKEAFLPCRLLDKYSFSCLFKPYDNRRLFILLPSAVTNPNRSRPYFFRSKWIRNDIFKGNVLCVADPLIQLYPNLNITWMIGDKDNDYIKNFAEIVKKLSKALGIEEIIFYGSSAGGFEAIWLAYECEGSTAIAINSQINVLDYPGQKHVTKFRKTLFNNLPKNILLTRFPERFDVKEKHSDQTSSRIVLMQNITDEGHYKYHFLPYYKFLQAGRFSSPEIEGQYHFGNHHVWIYNTPGGHKPETPEQCKEVLTYLNLD